jgi:anaerobic selenocysteine-containing dehydrogenase
VESPVGAVEVPVERSVDIRPGVVSLPHGYGQGLPGVQLSVAAAQPGANINHLIEAARVEPISGTAALSGQPVRLLPAP